MFRYLSDAMQVKDTKFTQTIGDTATDLPNICNRLMMPNLRFKEAFIKIPYKILRMLRQYIEGNFSEE